MTLMERYEYHYKWCDHKNKIPTIRTHKDGSKHKYYQCSTCGVGFVKSNIDKNKIWENKNIINFDEVLKSEGIQRRKDKKEEIKKWYSEYLFTMEWETKRQAVISRDNVCKMCGDKGSDIHHITYERLFNEVLDDLIFLCRKCHEKIHGHKIGGNGYEEL